MICSGNGNQDQLDASEGWQATATVLSVPKGIAGQGPDWYVCDAQGQKIRKVAADGENVKSLLMHFGQFCRFSGKMTTLAGAPGTPSSTMYAANGKFVVEIVWFAAAKMFVCVTRGRSKWHIHHI